MKYRIYIDEVGNPDLESSENPNHRFLSLTGVILELEYVSSTVHPQMEALKANYFSPHPDEPIVFHRKELVNAAFPFDSLKETKMRNAFDKELLKLLTEWEYTVITVCIDKKKHKETYNSWRYEPYHYCMAILLERFVFFLNRKSSRGDVMAESRGGKEDMRLKKSFHRLWEDGTSYVEPQQFQLALTSRELKVKPKANNIAGLQLTDILAHPSRNEILQEQGLLSHKMGAFGTEIIKIMQPKYDRESGKVYGKKFL